MNLFSFSAHFGTEDDCINHFKSERDKIGLTCKCGSTEHFWIKSRLSYECKKCRSRTSLKSGTIMENSNLSFLIWYKTMFLMSVTKKGFSAKEIQAYFKENHLNKVFTHPYTPQENGHIESFHAILSKKLKQYKFWSIQELYQVIILFYEKYNNQRLHSSICDLPPNIFIECWNKDLVEMQRDETKRIIKFKLKIKYDQISDNTSLKCSSSQDIVIPPVLADEQYLLTCKNDQRRHILQTSA